MLKLHIPNMSCGGCVRGVTAAIREIDATAEVVPDLSDRTVTLKTDCAEAEVRKTLAEAGFAPA